MIEKGHFTQLIEAVARHHRILPVRAEEAAAAVDLGNPDERMIVGRGEPRLAFAKRGLSGLAAGNVAQEAKEQTLAGEVGGSDRQLDREFVARGTEADNLDAPIEQRPLARGHIMSKASVVRFAVARRNDELAKLSADRLVARPAEGGFGDCVPSGDHPVLCHHDHGVESGVEDGGEVGDPRFARNFHWAPISPQRVSV